MQLFLIGPTPKTKTVGSQNVTISGAVGASGLIKIAATAHGLETGDIVQAFGITGTVEANGQWVITVVDANHFTLNNSTFANAYVSGGAAAHVGYATSGKLLDNTIFMDGAPNNLTCVTKLHSAPVNVTCRLVVEDSADSNFLTAMPAFTFGYAGGVGPSNDQRKSARYAEDADLRVAAPQDYMRIRMLWGSPVVGATFSFSGWLEY